MLDFKEEFLEVVGKDKEMKMKHNEYMDYLVLRDTLFRDITTKLNNHRNELQKEYGLNDFNYAKVCSLDDGDDVEDMKYCFKVKFFDRPSAKDLGVIEEITGCKYNGEYKDGRTFYFKLPTVIKYPIQYAY